MPEILSQRRERGVWMNKLVVAIKLEILFRAHLRVPFCGCCGGRLWVVQVGRIRLDLDALSDVGENLLGAKYAVCVEVGVAGCGLATTR